MGILLPVLVGIIAPILVELLRRQGAHRMSGPHLTAMCVSTGDELGHRKFNVTVSNRKEPNGLARFFLDARSEAAKGAKVLVRFFNERSWGQWENTFENQPFEMFWSENIPGDVAMLLGDYKRLADAKVADITTNQPKTVAVVVKADGRVGVLVPNAYRDGGNGRPDERQLLLDKHLVEVIVRHDSEPRGARFYFLLTNEGARLEQLRMEEASRAIVSSIRRLLRDSGEKL